MFQPESSPESNGNANLANLTLNIDSHSALFMLTFLHSGQLLPLGLNDLPGVFDAAQRFGIPELSEACHNKLAELANIKDEFVMWTVRAMAISYGTNDRLAHLLSQYHCETKGFDEKDYTLPDEQNWNDRKTHGQNHENDD